MAEHNLSTLIYPFLQFPQPQPAKPFPFYLRCQSRAANASQVNRQLLLQWVFGTEAPGGVRRRRSHHHPGAPQGLVLISTQASHGAGNL